MTIHSKISIIFFNIDIFFVNLTTYLINIQIELRMFGFLHYILNGISSSLKSFGRKSNRNFEMIFSNRFCMAQESFEGLGGIKLPPRGKSV